ncbi:hypothetical protein N7520_004980 [Penicillium odoratum]|uniref:uncharacterized protein n=1 Tax=Penicillium odoratum TaxID=1167516 RepID=UPI002548BD04|nr:uncharacterized protein N7520_004980 [Penicillium odoratum]KAJ5765421.1 hypothetical protein N7520_004980 [Penicillium odoratum]
MDGPEVGDIYRWDSTRNSQTTPQHDRHTVMEGPEIGNFYRWDSTRKDSQTTPEHDIDQIFGLLAGAEISESTLNP